MIKGTSSKTYKLFSLALLVKLCMFVVFYFVNKERFPSDKMIGCLSFWDKDVGDYFLPIENLIDGGTYGRNDSIIGWLWATRMPGWLPIYGPLYFLFGRGTAHAISLLLQVLVDALATVLVARIAGSLSKSKTVEILTFFIYAISAYVSTFNNLFRSDSFCSSFTIISLYYLIKAIDTSTTKHWLLSGFFITWATFMRPATGVLIPTYGFIVFIYLIVEKKIEWLRFIKTMGIFVLPAVIFISMWTYRNYKATHRIIPATTTNEEFFHNDPQRKALWTIIPAWGGALYSHGEESYFNWFLVPTSKREHAKLESYSPFSESIFTEDYNLDSLKVLRQCYWNSHDTTLTLDQRKEYQVACLNKVDRYLTSYKKHHQFYYIFGANMKLIKEFLFVKQTFALPFEKHTISHKLTRAFYFFLYYIVLLGFIAGAVILVLKRNKNDVLFKVVILVPLAIIFIHAIILGWIYNWYLAPIYPVLVIYAAYFYSFILERFPITIPILNKIKDRLW